MQLRFLTLAFCIVLGASTQSFAGLKEGLAAYEAENNVAALRELKPLADQGNAVAQRTLGHIYLFDHGNLENKEESVRWYRKAADQGDGEAQDRLSSAYTWGIGVAIDKAEASRWTRKAANNGFAAAQWSLGNMYRNGDVGAPIDRTEAFRWYQKSANQGYGYGLEAVGDCYSRGEGVFHNRAKATEYYIKAAKAGDVHATLKVGELYIEGGDAKTGLKWFAIGAQSGDFSRTDVERRFEEYKNRFSAEEILAVTAEADKFWIDNQKKKR